jgi:hypothetical protein
LKTFYVKELTSLSKIYGCKVLANNLILGDDILYSLHAIFQDYVLILLFGIVYPFCTLALGLAILSKIFILLRSISLCCLLQNNRGCQAEGIANGDLSYEKLELLVKSSRKYSVFLIWPGLVFSTVIFGIYLMDMAYDSPDKNTLAASIALFVIILFFLVLQIILFIWFKSIFDARLRITSVDMRQDCDNYSDRISATNPIELSNEALGPVFEMQQMERNKQHVVDSIAIETKLKVEVLP